MAAKKKAPAAPAEPKPKRARAPKPEGVEALQKSLSTIQGPIDPPMGSGAFEFPQFGFYRKTKKKPCAWGEKNKPFPTGRVELDIVTDRDAADLGVKPGPALRLCIGPNEAAPIVNVDKPTDAMEIGQLFRDCVVNEGKDQTSCALRTLKDKLGLSANQVKFAGAPKRRRSKRSSK